MGRRVESSEPTKKVVVKIGVCEKVDLPSTGYMVTYGSAIQSAGIQDFYMRDGFGW